MKNINPQDHIVLFLSITIGFFILYLINYIPVTKNRRNSTALELYLFIDNTCYHIHHWLSLAVVLFIIYFINRNDNIKVFNIIFGLILGALLEDFLFKDDFKFKNNCFKRH